MNFIGDEHDHLAEQEQRAQLAMNRKIGLGGGGYWPRESADPPKRRIPTWALIALAVLILCGLIFGLELMR